MRLARSLSTTLSAVSILMLAGSVPASALTPPVLTISESLGETVTIDSAGSITFGGTCTPTTCGTNNGGLVISAGSITWTGFLHATGNGNIQFTNFQGQSKPTLSAPQMSLGGRIDNFTHQPVTFTVQWSDTGFGPGESPATMTAAGGTAPLDQGGTGTGVITNVTFSAYVDTTNTLNGTQTLVNNINFPDLTVEQSSSAVGPGPSLDPFSMTEVEQFTMSGMQTGQAVQQVSYFFSNFTLSASPYPPLTLACPVASGQAGYPYASFLAASGGVPPYIYSITSGSLPAGLTLDPSSGAIQGTPQTAGTYPFTAQVMDSSGTTANTATSSCGIAISMPPAPPTLACSVATGLLNTPYNSNLVAMNGTPPYTFSIVSGSLPTGLFLNSSTGAIGGTPTSAGNGSFTAQVVDSSGDSESSTVTQACSINVYPSVTSTCVTINAIQGVAITPVQMTASGGTGTGYTFSATGLPTGVTMAANGTISGTPTVSGTFNYTVTITDSAGNTGTVNCSVTVAPPVTANCVAITAVQGIAITPVQMTASGGTGSGYTFSAVGLPAGLTMAANGTISGTPTVNGTFNYTVTITDSAGNTGTANCSVTVAPPIAATCVSITAIQGVAITPVTMTASGGTGTGYTFTATGLPTGLTISSSGVVSGTPTVSGTFPYTVTVKDSAGNTGTFNCSVTVAPPIAATCVSITAIQGVAITPVTMTASGGTGTGYTFTATGLPTGLTISSSGVVSGTPTVSGTFPYTVTVKDSAGNTGTFNCSVTVAPPISVTCSVISVGEVGVVFNSTAMMVTGGTAPYTFSVGTGTLPAGLTLNTSTGAITGTPTTAGTFTIQVRDINGVIATGTCSFIIMSAPSVGSARCGSVTSGEVGVAFNSPALTVTGGVAPYTFSIATGTLPEGLTLNTSTGAITGTPTAAGTFAIKVTDANSVVASTTCPFTIVPGLTVTCAATNTGTVGTGFNSGPITVKGGTAPYTFSVGTGTLPAGLTLNTSTGAVTGTATASGTFTIKVTDAMGAVGSACSITINPGVSVTCGVNNTGTVGVPFNSGPITVTGGAGPYTFTVVGNLPWGLTLNSSTGAVTGTPQSSGSFSIQATDSQGNVGSCKDSQGNPVGTACTITIYRPLSVNCSNTTTGTVGTAFNSGAITVTGGTAPYTFSVGTGTLPAGLTLNTSTGVVTGTPTASGTFTIKVTDAKGNVGSACSITINPGVSVTCGVNNTGTVGVAFSSGAITVTGGSAPYTFTVVGNLPRGLTLNTSTGAVTGTPTSSGSFSIQATDSVGNVGSCKDSQGNPVGSACTITINPGLSVTCSTTTTGTVGTAFNSRAITATGGTAPYTFSVGTGTLPAGLTLNTSTGVVTGTPTASGTFTIKVTDAKGNVGSACSITINPGVSVACGVNNTGTVGVAFNSGAITVTGGTAPYTFTVIGNLPRGLTLNTSTGAVTGTPQSSGSFSIQATDSVGNVGSCKDSQGNPVGSACTITIKAGLSVNCATATTGTAGTAFNSGAITATGGTAPYTFSVGTGTLPAGLTLNTSTGAVTGTPTASGTFTIKVTDAKGNVGSACSITINPGVSATCGANNTGTVGVAFNSGAITVTGGTAPYTFTVVGKLPWGLTLNTSTGAVTGTPTSSGTFSIQATDSQGNVGMCMSSQGINVGTACSITINPGGAVASGPISPGDAATIGFWHNQNGQALILSLNGGWNSEALANWLAGQFPYLYGPKSSNDLTNQGNDDVAQLFLQFFGQSGQKTSAQIMAGALAAYVTSSTMAGTNGTQYGFNSSSGGTGTKTYNVGSNGSSIGLVNNQSYTVLQLLQQANLTQSNGTFNANAFNTIFNGINTTGDIQ